VQETGVSQGSDRKTLRKGFSYEATLPRPRGRPGAARAGRRRHRRRDADRGIVNTRCVTSSKNVLAGKVQINIAGKNVAPSQMKYAECKIAKKVANKLLSLRIEKPKVYEGFRCTPKVLTMGDGTEEPQIVQYKCLFRGADTATEIKLSFKVTYNQD
jgi:hypothetical protein